MASSLSDILATIQQGVQALNNLGQRLASPWTAYTPTLTTNAGAFASASASGRFKTIGKTVFVVVDIQITTVGTANYPIITLPVAPLNILEVVFSGVEINLTGKSLSGRASGSNIVLTNYDNSIPSASGNRFIISGVYEAA